MNLLVILLTACLLSGLVAGAQLLSIATKAVLHCRGLTAEAAATIADLRSVFRSIYRDTVRESLPQDFHVLLGKLARLPQGARFEPGRIPA